MTTTARVEVLTAEVRVLQVGSRQITLSVARQLDEVPPDDIEPFSRICTGRRRPFAAVDMIEVVGAADDGALVRSMEIIERYRCSAGCPEMSRVIANGQESISLNCPDHQHSYDLSGHFWQPEPDVWRLWSDLPLIVLAGLR